MTAALLAAGTIEDFTRAFIQGLPVGSVFALVAISFVLTYKTSGVFNLAFGAQAYIAAATYFEFHIRRGLPKWAAGVIAIAIVSPLVGITLERLVFRNLLGASAVAKLVVSLGLLVALPEMFNIITDFDRESTFGAVGLMPDGDTVYRIADTYPVNRDQIFNFAVVIVVSLGLAAMFRYTRIGLQMRAVVQSPRMTELNGINSDRVSSVAWALSSLLAGLAGVLVGPTTGAGISAPLFFPVVVAALAAAALGRLVNLPWALAGGFVLGILNTELRTFLPRDNVLTKQLGPSLPFLVLFGIIVLWPAIRRQISMDDPLAGVDPPPPGLAASTRGPGLAMATRVASLVFFGLVGLWVFTAASDLWILRITQAAILSIIFMSITVFTGMTGQISLAQSSFAAMGAFSAFQLVDRWDTPVLLAMVIGAAIAAAVAAVLAIPVLRLDGVWLALATLAFALFFDSVIVRLTWVGGDRLSVPTVPRPVIGPIDFESRKVWLVLVIIVLVIVSYVVISVREGTTGMGLRALRGSKAAAESIGVVPWRLKVIAFSLSAGIAAIGGALLAMDKKSVAYTGDFVPFQGMFWLVIVVVLGARTVEGAIQAGIGFRLFAFLVLEQWLHLSPSWRFVMFGLAAITFARHPEGLLEHGKRRLLTKIQAAIDRRHSSATTRTTGAPS